MKFTQHYIVRWHDTDANRCLTPSNLLMYMEETSNFHLMANGMSLDELRDRHGLAFLLSRIAIRVQKQLHAGDEIDVETWICESRGLAFVRCFRVLCAGEIAAEAYSVWGLMDLNCKKLLPATAFPYHIEPDSPLDTALSARIKVPMLAKMELVGNRKIVYSDIDYNRHMNNTHYPNMLCDFVPNILGKKVVGITLSFLHEAAYGHTLQVYRAACEGDYFFRMLNEEGVSCLEAVLLTEPITDAAKESREK